MRVLIASTYVPFLKGGGTQIVEDLRTELVARGFETDTVCLPLHSAWTDIPEQTAALRLLDLTETCGNRIDRLITVRYPAYALRHPNKVAWFLHHHREAYDLWGTKWCGIPDNPVGHHYRDMVRRSDDTYLRECRKIFTISRRVADRVVKFNGFPADGVLYPPLPSGHIYRPGPFGDYLLYASRLNPIKRQDLAIDAMRFADPDVRLVIAGAPDVEAYTTALERRAAAAGVADRVTFTGWVSEERKAELMAGCCGAVFIPYDEDYGYVTLEAFHSQKPVITLEDSGGSLEFVVDGYNGYVSPADPKALGEAMTRVWRDRREAARLGANGYRTLADRQIDWDRVVEELTT